MSRASSAWAIIVVLLLATPAGAQRIDHVTEYAACLDLVRDRPEQAYESAWVWHSVGGGDGALHCAALALMRTGRYAKAAEMLINIAANGVEVGRTPPGTIYGQAADALRLAKQPDKAAAVIEKAAKRDPKNLALQFELARVLVETDRPKDALKLLEEARMLRYDPDTLAVRAGALNRIGRPLDALESLNEALMIDPTNVWALLVRARMLRAGRQLERAKADYATIIENYTPQPVATTAEAELGELLAKGR
ncbi:MAG: tetratricopeptide repeat protein [Alphaproteobacteria bacterium]